MAEKATFQPAASQQQEHIAIREHDFCSGIDSWNSENDIMQGYVEDAINVDVVQSRLRKRQGYQVFAQTPVVAQQVDYDNDGILVTFPLSVNLSTTPNTPVIVAGTIQGENTYPFSLTYSELYSEGAFPVLTRDLPAGQSPTPPSFTLTASETGFTSEDYMVRFTQQLNGRLSNTTFEVNSISINATTFDTTVTYDSAEALKAFVYFQKLLIDTTAFKETFTIPASPTGIISHRIDASSHNLPNGNYIIDIWQLEAGSWLLTQDHNTFINTNDGSVNIEIVQDGQGPLTFKVTISSVPALNARTDTLSSGNTTSITIPNAETPFLIYSCYHETTPPSSQVVQVWPDVVSYDETANTHTLTFNNVSSTAYVVHTYFTYGDIISNRLRIPIQGGLTPATFLSPQIAVYGLLNKSIYTLQGAGVANHIDAYRREGSGHILTSVGGNIFKAIEKADVPLPRLYANMQARTSAFVTLAPAFFNPVETSNRTRGYITTIDSPVGIHALPCVSVQYTGTDNLVRYTLQATANAYVGGANPIQVGDTLTIDQMSYSFFNGNFLISSITRNTDSIEFVVVNTNVSSSDYDDFACGGIANIWSDVLPVLTSKYLLPDDLLVGGNLTDLYTTVASIPDNTTIIINGILSEVEIPDALRISAQRIGMIVPLRDVGNNPSVGNVNIGYVVAGDVILSDRYVHNVNSSADEIVGISNTTITVSNTSRFSAGEYILLATIGAFQIDSITNTTQMELVEAPGVTSAILLGYTINVDQETFFTDSTTDYIDVERRFYMAVSPSTAGDLVTDTHPKYFPDTPTFGDLPIRSVMAADNMYLVDGTDNVMKYDGENLYQASLPNWNPLLFARLIDETAGSFGQSGTAFSKIESDNKGEVYIEADNSNRVTVAPGQSRAADVNLFSPNDSVRVTIIDSTVSTDVGKSFDAHIKQALTENIILSTDGTTIPSSSSSSVVAGYLFLDTGASSAFLSTSSSAMVHVKVERIYAYKYYFRLNAVDANQNIIASAAVGTDVAVAQSRNGNVHFRFIQPPVWGIYDYDHIEIQVYRTAGDGTTYKRDVSIPVTMDSAHPYIDYIDKLGDTDLTAIDPTSIRINGEIGTTFNGVAKAKYATTASNSLILGNITSDPRLSIIINDTYGLGGVEDFTATPSVFSFTSSATGDTRNYECVSSLTPVINITYVPGEFTLYTTNPHNLVEGDWVYVCQTNLGSALVDDTQQHILLGYWQIFSATADSFTIKNKEITNPVPSYPTPAVMPSFAQASVSKNIPLYLGTTLTGVAGTGDLDLSRGKATGASSNYVINKLVYILSQAINASMRAVDTSLPSEAQFKPWLMALTSDNPGEILLTSNMSAGFTAVKPTIASDIYALFANQNTWVEDTTGSLTTRYPSRILVSYPNYPELFDNIYAIDTTQSNSAIDVNPDDGQEITGIVPFFGTTTFGAAMKGAVVVVFKQYSVYVINVAAKEAGQDPVQKLETNGIGCSAPRSIATSKSAIFFSSDAGIYALRVDMTLDYIGKYLERMWSENTNQAILASKACGHQDPIGKKYILSYPAVGADENDSVFAYHYLRERDKAIQNFAGITAQERWMGSWTRYTNYAATGWCNLDTDEYFSSTFGWVYRTRRSYTANDFADEGAAISSTILFRAMDFENSGIRKHLRHVIAHYRLRTSLTETSMYLGVDTSNDFTKLDNFSLTKGNNSNSLIPDGKQKIVSIAHSCTAERGLYFQIKVVDSGLREGIDITGLDYLVLPLSHHGIQDAIDTPNSIY